MCLLDLALGFPESISSPRHRLGDYELLDELGRGGMGVVYRARQISLNRVVAVKLILAGKLATPKDVARFRAEAEAAARLRHPHIVGIYQIGEEDGQDYFSMEYVDGPDLNRRVHDEPLSVSSAAECVQKIAAAVEHAHSNGVLHRDLKPSNILIDQLGEPHITDFGLAKQMGQFARGGGSTRDLTLTGEALGSPSFMPPEQVGAKAGDIGVWSDIYGIGAILYYLITGRAPFQAQAVAEVFRQVREDDPLPPRLFNSAVPRDLETICLKCLSKDQAKRYDTAQALVEDLSRFRRHEPIRARPATSVHRIRRWCQRRPAMATALASIACLLLAMVIGGFAGLRRIQQAAAQLRQRNYAADVNLASHLLEERNVGRARELLDRQIPSSGEKDLRGLEWHLLKAACQGDEQDSLEAHSGDVRCVALSPLTNRMITVGFDRTIRLWDSATKRLEKTLGTLVEEPSVAMARFSAAGRYAAVGCTRGISVWDARTWQVVTNLAGSCMSLAFVHEDSLLFSHPNGISRLSIQDQSVGDFLSISGDGRSMVFIATSAAGEKVAVAAGPNVCIYDSANGQMLKQLADNNSEAAYSLAFSPNGHFLALGGLFGRLKVWSVRDGKLVLDTPAHRFFLMGLAFSPDGGRLVTSGSEQFLQVWSVPAWQKEQDLVGHTHQIWDVTFNPRGNQVVSASRDHTVKFWDLEQPRPKTLLPDAAVIGFTPDSRNAITAEADGTLRFRSLATDAVVKVLPPNRRPAISDATVNNDGRTVLAGYYDGIVQIRSLSNGAVLKTVEAGKTPVIPVKFSADESAFGTLTPPIAGGPGELRLWRASSGAPESLPSAFKSGVTAFAFAHHGSLLAVADADYRVSLVDQIAANVVRVLPAHGWVVTDLAFSADDEILASSSADTVTRLWNTRTGERLAALKSQSISVDFLCFSPDGLSLATGGQDRTIVLWHLATHQELLKLPWKGNSFMGRPLFSPDGGALAVGTLLASYPGGSVQLWRASTTKQGRPTQ